jgi:hypothetical protein
MMRQIFALLTIAGAIGIAAPAARGTTYYVNGACGSDAWSGLGADCVAPDGPKATIQAGLEAASDGDVVIVAAGVYKERIDLLGKAVTLRSAAGPEATVIDAERTGRVVECSSGEGPDTLLEGFTITGGNAGGDVAGGMYIHESSPTVRNCVIRDNIADNSAGMRIVSGSPLIEGCRLLDNRAIADGGMTTVGGRPVIKDCLFRDNSGFGGTLVIANSDGVPPLVLNCRFISNSSGALSAGAIDGGRSLFVNCVFSDNTPGQLTPGALIPVGPTALFNCTFSNNTGYAIYATGGGADLATVVNSILWGNSTGSLGGEDEVTVSFSDVEGGWPGSGNIDDDPMFVQPGLNDVRLAFGSPCVNAGSNADLPPDELDLDGDGDTDEAVPFDAAGNARIQGGLVDLGAYEGEFQALPPAEGATNLDQGDFVVLVPGGGAFDPLTAPAVMVSNESGADDATFVVTQVDWDPHPAAGGFSELSAVLATETSLADGEYLAIVCIPFTDDDIGDNYPYGVGLTWYDPVVGNWALAVAANTAPSPGFPTRFGNQVIALPGEGWGITNELGDFGFYWDIVAGQGFAWAAVDHAGEFGVGAALCPADCRQTPDGVVDVADVLAMLATWGGEAEGGPCDIDGNRMVDAEDLVLLLDAWGSCPRRAASPMARPTGSVPVDRSRRPNATYRSADVDGDGIVGRRDFRILRDEWGPCPGCASDLDGDGEVGITDALLLTAGWD